MDQVFKLVLATAGASSVTSALANIQGSFAKLIGVAGALTGSLSSVKSALNSGTEIQRLHLRTGQTVQDLSLLQSAFKKAGLDADSLATNIARMHRSIDTAVTQSATRDTKALAKEFKGLEEEGAAAGDAFNRLGLSAQQLKNTTARQQFEAIAAAMAKLPTPVERSAIAMKLFGKSGTELIQLFSKEGIFDAPESASRMAHRLQDDAASFERVNLNLGAINSRMKEMWIVAAEQLLPALEKIAATMKALNLAPLGAALGASTSMILPALGIAALRPLDNFILGMATNPRLAGSIRQSVAGALAPLTGSLAKILPVGLAAAVTTAVVVGIYAAYKETQNQKLDRARTGFDQLREIHQSAADVRTPEGAQDVAARAQKFRTEILNKLFDEQNSFFKTDASERAIASYKQQLEEIDSTVRLLNGDWSAHRIELNQAADAAARTAAAEASAREWLGGADAAASRKSIADDLAAVRDPEERLRNLRAGVAIANQTITLINQESDGRKKTATEEAFLLKTQQQRADNLHTIATLEEKIARTKTTATTQALEEAMRDIGARKAALEGSFALTELEKYGKRKVLLSEEIALQQRYLDKLNALRLATTDDAARATYAASAHQAVDQLTALRGQQASQGPDPTSNREQMLAQFTALQNGLQTVQQNLAATFGGAITAGINAANAGLQQLLGTTEYWSQRLGNIAGPVLGAVSAGIANMFTQWIAGRALAFLKSLIFQKAETAANLALAAGSATALSALWAVPATLATIASWGGAAAGAPPAIFAAQGIVLGASIAGFERGGYTGEDGGVVHKREFVFSAPAVRNIGLENLERVHRNATTATPAASFGSSGSGDSARHMHFYFDPALFARAQQQHTEDIFRTMSARDLRS